MAIYLLTGKPRSGKSYWAVYSTIIKYFNRSKSGLLTLKPEFKDLKIISNIEGLKIPHDSLDDLIVKYGNSDKFFCYDSQKAISLKYPQIVYLIDECQFFFPEKFSNEKVFNWFQLHGHFGQDIYLITQDKSAIPFKLQKYVELHRDALPRSVNLFSSFLLQYNIWQNGQLNGKPFVLKRNWVFDYYKSQNSKETDKVSNPFLKYMVPIAIGIIFGTFQVYKVFKRHSPKPAQSPSVASSSVNSSPASNHQEKSVPIEKPKTTTRLSYFTENGIVYVVFDNIIYKQKDFPFKITNGPFKTLLAEIPTDLLQPKNEITHNPDKKTSSFL